MYVYVYVYVYLRFGMENRNYLNLLSYSLTRESAFRPGSISCSLQGSAETIRRASPALPAIQALKNNPR